MEHRERVWSTEQAYPGTAMWDKAGEESVQSRRGGYGPDRGNDLILPVIVLTARSASPERGETLLRATRSDADAAEEHNSWGRACGSVGWRITNVGARPNR